MSPHPTEQGPADMAPDYIQSLPRYVPGKPPVGPQGEQAPAPMVMLASNENPLGASPKAIEAIVKALAGVASYPDPDGLDLKAALSRRFGLKAPQIVLGNGSSELVDLAARSYLRVGDEAVRSQYSFIAYPRAVKSVGAVDLAVPAQAHGHDLPAMAAAVTQRTRLVFVANPNNPTGTALSEAQIRSFLEALPGHVLVILDEAYHEYLPPAMRMDSFALAREFRNLVVVRTFSKAYGLAGLRVGYAVADPAVAELMNRTRMAFNVNALAQCAAMAALFDDAFLAQTHEVNLQGLKQLTVACAQLGLPCIPSFGNFIAIDFSNATRSAAEVHQRLLALGFIVRPLGPYGLGNHLRVTTGLSSQNAGFINALQSALQ